jgi:16S rRNA (uracil1498-N3)-methyltransferase
MGVNSLPWYYLARLGQVGDEVKLSGDEWHHCYHVVRLKPGDSLILTDGQGKCMEGKIVSHSQKEGILELIADREIEFRNPRSYKVSIGLAPTKNIDRTEFAIEKLVELGIDEIAFLDCKHAERRQVRLERFEKIILAAAKQSKKITFPVLVNLISPGHYIFEKKQQQPDTTLLCGHLDDFAKNLKENYSAGDNVVMLIGPEGGFARDEIDEMIHQNVKLVKLGPFRLRVETAAISACAGIHLINELNDIS